MNKIITFLQKYTLLLLFIGGVIVVFTIQNNTIKKLEQSTTTAITNNKALFNENNALKDGIIMFKFTIDQLEYFNDSINHKLDSVTKDNKIKDKNLKQLQYQKTSTSKTDTVIVKDTIFRKDLKIDTTLIHPGYTLKLKLEYPNKIITTPTFINEQYTIIHLEKQTINPPKKLFLLRWFQKKHTVVTVDVYNTNEYVDIKEKRFIEIIK